MIANSNLIIKCFFSPKKTRVATTSRLRSENELFLGKQFYEKVAARKRAIFHNSGSKSAF